MAKRIWINFKELRPQLDFEKILQHYDVEVKPKGDNQVGGFCPLPDHQGNRKTESFSVNLERKIFNCFGCGGSGNVIDFAVLMEGHDKGDGKRFREVAEMLHNEFVQQTEPASPPKQKPEKQPELVHAPSEKSEDDIEPFLSGEELSQEDQTMEVAVNAPLNFELKKLDPGHEYLADRGFSTETVEHFGAGYCNRGIMKGRIAIPLKNSVGDLIGYAGRLADDSAIDSDHPKYMFPGKREHDGKRQVTR